MSEATAERVAIRVEVNGEPHDIAITPDRRLLDLLRDDLSLTGTKDGCGVGVCGVCSVLVDGRAVSACLYPAFLAAGRRVTTIEGLAAGEDLAPLQQAFIRQGGFQCGICTPGQIVAAAALLAEEPAPTDARTREWLGGNLCRCTGYYGIVASVLDAAGRPVEDTRPPIREVPVAAAAAAPGHASHDDHGVALPPDAGTLALLQRPEERIDGPDKVTGNARYAADRRVSGALHARFLGSPVAHARIRAVDTAAARAMPGVRAVLTGEDARGVRFGRRLQDRPVLAWDRALFVGDRIAAIAADSPAIAEAAAAAIDVDLEELPALLDPEAALRPDAPVLHPDAAGYAFLDGERKPVPHPNVQGRVLVQHGEPDIEAVFALAAHVVERAYRTPRQHSAYLEPHATVVSIDADGVGRIVSTNKAPYTLRKQMSTALGVPVDRIEVDSGVIGGDFGGKGYSIDEYGCWLLAQATGRPVRAVAEIADELGRLNVRHAATLRLRTAVDADGRLLAHDARIILDGGAYASAKPLPTLVPGAATATLAGYRVPNVRIEATTVYTNTVPAGHMRSPGEVQALFAGESQLDELAHVLGEDPLAFRLRNAVRGGDRGAAGQNFREARAVEVLTEAGRAIGWDRERPAGRGVGIAMSARHVGVGKMPLKLRLHHDGRVEVVTGLPDQGGGTWQVIRRSLAVASGIDERRIVVSRVPTSGAPFDPGVGGSRATHIASRAAERLGGELRAWLDERLPAALPNAGPGVELRDDRFVDPAGGRGASFEEVVGRAVEDGRPVELSAVYEAAAHGDDEPGDYDFAACAVEVEVDVETGRIAVRDAVLAVDVGTVINPLAHRGQLEGGFVFGLGAALMEELVMDGGAVTTLSFADLLIPAPTDVPPLRIVHVPSQVGPGAFGAKMAGELTNALVAPAVANAVADAVGVRVTELPLTAERVLRALGAGPGLD